MRIDDVEVNFVSTRLAPEQLIEGAARILHELSSMDTSGTALQPPVENSAPLMTFHYSTPMSED
jgi:hypothetical protein